ncbi:hypothetical protein ID853_18130, partial [Xenorhabdus sp. Vera]|nr:hypothetical protein [Xenorhabdus sp. Vera]
VKSSKPATDTRPSSLKPDPVIPLVTPGTASAPDTAEDTRTLLSLFQAEE